MKLGIRIEENRKWLIDLTTGEILATDSYTIQNFLQRNENYTLQIV